MAKLSSPNDRYLAKFGIRPVKDCNNLEDYVLSIFQLCIYTILIAKARYDTKSIFKQSKAGLNSEFYF